MVFYCLDKNQCSKDRIKCCGFFHLCETGLFNDGGEQPPDIFSCVFESIKEPGSPENEGEDGSSGFAPVRTAASGIGNGVQG